VLPKDKVNKIAFAHMLQVFSFRLIKNNDIFLKWVPFPKKKKNFFFSALFERTSPLLFLD